MGTLYIDAMNVIGSRPDGWWHDRDAAVRRFVDDLQAYAEVAVTEVVVVVDGRPSPGLPEGRHGAVEVRYAIGGGPGAADDRIVELVAAGGTATEVVTADRELRDRVQTLGARVLGPRALLDRLARGDT
ncbi:MAG: NYN domain-containing protein [Dehalococcoidia bacterium]